MGTARPPQTTVERLRPLGLLALLLVALGLRLIAIDFQPLWWDEGYSFLFSTETLPDLLALTSLDIHPPLYYLLLKGWMMLLGVGVWQARLLSVFCALLTLPLFFQLARRVHPRAVAWIATILLAFAPLHIYYAQEVRMYALLTLLVVALLLAWQRRAWAWTGLFGGLALLTHYYALWLLLVLALLTLRDWRRGALDTPRGPMRAALVALLLFAPWAIYSAARLWRYVGGKLAVEADLPLSPLAFVLRHLGAWSVGHPAPGGEWLSWGALLFVAIAALGAWRLWRTGPREWLWLFGGVTLVVFLINLRTPFVDARIERQLLYLLPLFLLFVAEGVVALARRWRGSGRVLPAVLLLIMGIALWRFYTVPRYPDEDYRPLLALVGTQQAPEDGWLAIYPWQIGYLRAYLPTQHPAPHLLDPLLDEDDTAREQRLTEVLGVHPRLWLPAYQVQGRLFEEKLVRTLDEAALPVWNEWEGNTRLYLYGAPPAQLPALVPVGEWASQGEGYAVLGADTTESGTGVIPVFFELATPDESARASLQLVADDGVWGEWDRALQPGVMRAGLPVPPGTPPGTYEVRLTLYDDDSEVPYDVQRDGQLMPVASLGRVTVQRADPPMLAEALQQMADQPLDERLGDSLRLLGYDLDGQRWQQGDGILLTLHWQVTAPIATPQTLVIQALDQADVPRAALEVPLPSDDWQANDLLRDPYRLWLPADLPGGEYRLIVGLYETATGERLTTPDGDISVPLETIEVTERVRTMVPPSIGEPLDVAFGSRARLAEAALPGEVARGSTVSITLLWQATESGGPPLRAFVQLATEEGAILSSDHPLDPPANSWLRGEWIVDEHALTLPADLPPGRYRLITGLYDPATGQRLPPSTGEVLLLAEWSFE